MRYAELLRRLGDNLRDRRGIVGTSQEGLAHVAGISVRTLAALERGDTPSPSLASLHAVSEALGIDLAELFRARPVGPRPKGLRPGRKPAVRRLPKKRVKTG